MTKNKKEVEYKTVRLFCVIAIILEPPPNLKISDWADSYRRLSAEASAEPGQWSTSRAEFQREIMNAVNDPVVSDVVVKSSAQVGKTEIILNIIGYYVDYDPTPIMVLQPTIDMAETFSKDRLAPMIRDTPALKNKIKDAKSRDSENTILHKKFPGGHITLAGSNSPASLASRPIRILLCDEVDRYPESAGTEGKPIKLAEKRTTTFWNRKKIKVSTPTIEGRSNIDTEYKQGTQEEWCVKCPCCGTYQPYEFRRIIFKDATMECISCKEQFIEREWKEQPHKWIAGNPDVKRKRSFHLNELCSPWKTWEEIIQDFKDAKEEQKRTGLTEALKVFINTSLGECWREQGDGADDKELLERREMYASEIPDGVLLLTAGVDVQDDRLEIEVVGWRENNISWGIYKTEIFSDPALDETWNRLVEYLDRPFCFGNGNTLHIAATCIDTGGHKTNRVYKFIKSMHQKNKKVYGVKGYANTPGIPLIYKKTKVEIKDDKGNAIDSTEIYILGVDAGKEDIISWLKIKDPETGGYCHFPENRDRGYNETYMAGLTSEEKVTKVIKNKLKVAWVKKAGVRNEPLDLRNYAYAAEQLLNPNYDKLETKIIKGIDYMVAASTKKCTHKRGVIHQGFEV